MEMLGIEEYGRWLESRKGTANDSSERKHAATGSVRIYCILSSGSVLFKEDFTRKLASESCKNLPFLDPSWMQPSSNPEEFPTSLHLRLRPQHQHLRL